MYFLIYICTFVILILLFNRKKKYGYLNAHIKNITTDFAKDFNYKIIRKYNNYTQNYHFDSIAFNNKEIVGNLQVIPWYYNNNDNNCIYIGKDLYVLEKFQKKGIANEIVKNGINAILKKNSFGIFCTNKKLSLPDCVFKLYWKKNLINTTSNKLNINNLKVINYDKVSLKNYPYNNKFLNTSCTKIYNFLKYLASIDIIFLQDQNNIFAVERYKDSDNDYVAYIKFFWVDNIKIINRYKSNICKLLNVKYIANPELLYSDEIPHNTWDIAYYYLYAKPSNLKYNIFTKKDIFGWFLC